MWGGKPTLHYRVHTITIVKYGGGSIVLCKDIKQRHESWSEVMGGWIELNVGHPWKKRARTLAFQQKHAEYAPRVNMELVRLMQIYE